MRKRSYFFSFAKGVFFALLLGFVAMLYWSTHSIETQIVEIKKEIDELESGKKRVEEEAPVLTTSKYENPELPNLLTEDPFYEKTLPTLLGENFKPEGNFRGAIVGKPPDLHPFSNWGQVNAWRSQCEVSVSVNHFGIFETMAPFAAYRMEQRGNEFWVFLRPGLFWEPIEIKGVELAPLFSKRHPVTAEDFKFYFDAMMNPFVEQAGAVALRNYYADIIDFRVVDPQTFVVAWKMHEGKIRYGAKLLTGELRPLASFVYQNFPNGEPIIPKGESFRTNSVWAQNFANHFAKHVIPSCGPWVFKEKTDTKIELFRNDRFIDPLRALMGERETIFKSNPSGPWQDFKAGQSEAVVLLPEQLLEWETFLTSDLYKKQQSEGMGAKRLDYLTRSFSYIGWNQNTPYFASRKVRLAMTMAIDRKRIIQSILNGMGSELTGPIFIGSPSYDKTIEPWPYDPIAAKRLLEEEGWYDSDANGIRDKNGIPFSFALTYYVKNETTRAVCEYVATALKEVGIECRLNGVDITDLSQMFDEKNFDAIMLAWGLGVPPEDPRQLWSSRGAKEKGSSNAIGFSNTRIDEIIDALDFAYEPEIRQTLYREFHKIMHEEAPYTFLFTPKAAMVYRENLQNVWIPSERQDLVPGANIPEPQSDIFWLKP